MAVVRVTAYDLEICPCEVGVVREAAVREAQPEGPGSGIILSRVPGEAAVMEGRVTERVERGRE